MRHSIAVFLMIGFAKLFCLVDHGLTDAEVQTPPISNRSDSLSQLTFNRIRVVTQFESLRVEAPQQINLADIKIAVGAASPSLVNRQYLTIASGDVVIAAKEFDADGGTLATTVSALPSQVRVTITVDFQPQWALPSFIRIVDKEINSSGMVGLIQVFSDETTLFVDHGFYVQYGDHLIGTLRVKRSNNDVAVISRPLATYSKNTARAFDGAFAYVADVDPQNIDFEISGRLRGCVPGVLGSLRNNAIKESTAVHVQWMCPANRPIFVPIATTIPSARLNLQSQSGYLQPSAPTVTNRPGLAR
jgi:hypothetical protein